MSSIGRVSADTSITASNTLKVLSREPDHCSVRSTGPELDEVGQRHIRDIEIDGATPLIHFHNVMQILSGFPQNWSEQTITEYAVSVLLLGSENFDKNFYGVTEVNPKSAYTGKPYFIRTEPQDNPGFEVNDGTFRVHWNDIMQEVWIDSPSGWLAAVNGDTGYSVVERHDIDRTHSYPGDASISFLFERPAASEAWCAGKFGGITARGAVYGGRGEQPHGGAEAGRKLCDGYDLVSDSDESGL